VGKTTIARMLPEAVFLNCDLPSAVRALEDPELFLSAQAADAVLVFDEVLRLIDPSRLLKIAADEYPHLKVLATGSSTLAATRKFSDTLTGRKRAIHLCPVLWEECAEPYGVPDLDPDGPLRRVRRRKICFRFRNLGLRRRRPGEKPLFGVLQPPAHEECRAPRTGDCVF
jgi:predicted AAA+ superfamily ATPase